MKESGDLVIARDWVTGTARGFFKTIGAMLREIFDESAYERFLRRAQAPQSIESYRAFMQERESATAQKPRCC